MRRFLHVPFSKILLLLIFLSFSVAGFAQQMDLRGNSEYTEGQCPANDIEILSAMVELGTPCNDCTPGSTITGDLIITVRHGTNSQNRYLAVMGDLTETLPSGASTMSTFAECSGPLATQNSGNNGVQELNYGQVTFMCGSELVLDNILLVWTAAMGECPVTPANNPNGKYCYANPTINITPPLNAMASASCTTGNNVDVDLTVQGGVMPFTYAWSNGATTEDLSNVAPGTYTVVATGADGCTATTSITVGPSLSAFTIQKDVLCFGEATGEIDLTFAGGVSPYTLLWSTTDGSGLIQNNGTQTNLTAGTYTITVTDGRGCEVTENVIISQPSEELTCNVVEDNPASSGNSDGEATVTPSGGTAPYTYLWDNGETTQTATTLNGGVHTVTVTDDNGCETTCEVTIQELDPLECTVALVQDEQCFGDEDGSATANPVGGVAPYTYLWDNGETDQTATSLAQGLHTVTVTDANGATSDCEITIGGPSAALAASTTQVDVLCFGESTGSVDLTVTGGTTAYTYSWSNGATTEDLTDVAAGTYDVTITDANGCETTASATVNEPAAALSGSAVATDVLCFGESTGSVDLTVTGGTTAYSYLWSNGATTEDLTDVAAGTYDVTITDANGCETTASATVSEPTAVLTCSVMLDNGVSVNGASDGSATVTEVGGTSGYTYSWDNGENTQTAIALNAGVHVVTVTDANGCETTCEVTIPQPDELVCSVALVQDEQCFGDADGSATANPVGGVAPYTYLWDNGETDQTATGLAQGLHTVTVTDANGATSDCEVTIGGPSAALAASTTQVDVPCFGESTGSVDLTVTGGTTAYSYLWSNGATTEDLTDVAAGTYDVTITDANGCETTASATVSEPAAVLTCSVMLDNGVSVNGASDGSATVTAVGGTSGYTYSWDNGENTQTAIALNAGVHVVTVTDANGCETTCEVTIPQPDELVCSVALVQDEQCFGDADGSATANPVGGVAPYTYLWDNGETDQTATGLAQGLHTVTVTDANGATSDCEVTIGGPSAALAASTTQVDVPCFGESTGSVDLTVTGGTTAYTYAWSNGATTEDLTDVAAGTYTVLVIDANGCEITNSVTIIEPIAPLSSSSTQVDVLCFGDATGSIDLTVNGGTPDYTFLWSNGATTEDISDLVAGTYDVTITDANGCETTDSVTISEPAIELMCSIALDMGVSVNGASDGAATVTPTGGTSGYIYLWDNNETTQTATALSAGIHTVTVTDANNCETTCEVMVPEPDQLVCNVTLDSNVLCNGDSDGVATVTPMGGVAPYTYLWDNGETTETATSLNAGLHSVTVTDANGAETSCEVTISEPADLTCTIMLDNGVSINGGSDGAATVNPVGGTTAYTYLWDNGETTQQAVALDAGVHMVTVTDANGCETTCEVTVTEPDTLSCSIDLVGDVTCNAGNDGSATANPIGGVAPFMYAWDNGETGMTATTLTAGLHTVMVTDANGAQTTCEITITEPEPPNAGDDNMTRVCDGTQVDLTLLVSEMGGTFTDDGMSGGLSGSSFDTTGLGSGTYDITYSVEGATPNCPVDTATITIIVDTLADAGDDNETTVCDGEMVDLTSLVSVMGGSFSDPGLTGGLSGTDFDTSGLSPGSYDLIYTVGSGNQNCPDDSATITINVDVPNDAGADNSTEVCESTVVDLGALVSEAGGTFSDPGMTGGLNGNDFNTSGLTPGNYDITYTVSSGNTCPDDTATITVKVLEDIITQSCEVLDIDFCNPNEEPYYNLFWFEMPPESRFFSQSGMNSLSFTEFTNGTALIKGSTQVGTCTAEVYIVLKDLKDWAQWSADGGMFKPQGCDPGAVVKENLRYYVIDETQSTITTTGGDCVEEGTFTVSQRPDPNDPNTPNLGVHIGPGGALYDSDTSAEGLAGWGWMGPQGDEQRYRIDFNFHIDCEDGTGCEPQSDLECIINPSVEDVSCFDGNDGSATVSASGGVGPYTYLWDNGETTATATMLAAGSHTVVIFDADGNKTDCSVEIEQPEELACETILVAGVSADGANDGSATVTPDGGTTPYTYLWDNGETVQTAIMLSAGTHSVKVIDTNGCETVCYVDIPEAGQFTCFIKPDSDIGCFGEATGSATVEVIGGMSPYTFLWDNGETSQMATMLPAGMRTVTVSDANGRESTCTILVDVPDELTCMATVFSNVSSNGGDDGSATVTPNGGTAPFTYLWDNGETTAMAVALDAGLHTVTVTDSNGCETSCEVTLMEPDSISCEALKISDTLCHDSEDGSAQVMVNGGMPPYSYSWDNGEDTQTAIMLSAGLHTVMVTDNDGVETSCEVLIEAPSQIMPTASLVSGVTISGGKDGSASVDAAGGTPPYTYLWDNGEMTETAVMLTAGLHTVKVTDANGCEAMAEVRIASPDALICSVMLESDVICNGESNGSATVMPTGGVMPYSYLWDNGETVETAIELNAGMHTVTVTDANGAQTSCEIEIEEPMESISATATQLSAVSAVGEEDGVATVSADGGTPPYTYLWDNGETTQMASMLSAGMHTVTVTDANGCEAEASVTITEPNAFTCEITLVNHVSCNGGTDGSATATPTGGVAPYTYFWFNFETGQTATALSARDTHWVIITDATGREAYCEITIEEPPVLMAEATHDSAVSAVGEEDGVATVSVDGGTSPYTYLWDNGETTQTATMLSAGMHTVTVTDANGCEVEASVTIREALFSCEITLVNHVSCNGGTDGSATATAIGGVAPYTYFWFNSETGQTATALSARDTHWVIITDATGREAYCEITIEEPSQLTCEITDMVDSDEGEDNGEATVLADGGIAPYTYLWNDVSGQTTATATDLSPGTYEVIVTDANGCETQCEVTIAEIPDATPTGCETAFARYEVDNTCFIDDGFNRWGWTNFFDSEGTYTMDLYAGAGQCDLSKGEKTGEVTVEYNNGSVSVSVDILSGFIMQETQLYVGADKYPTKGNGMPTVAPGQYPQNSGSLNNVTTYEFDDVDVSGINGGVYVIVHANTCKSGNTTKKITQTVVTPYPMTFKDKLSLSIDIPYSADLKIEMFDVNGRCVMTKESMNVKEGTNDVELNVSSIAPDMYFLVINTGREKIVKKVMSIK
ncbi:T9SS type A sorting domain-containing protein [Maribacter algarum]|uniref:T9SS type A sorting domain-containing protein n=1 Tax=Maribacter algarum (ex Zhang et al. 2020) TaxID=2578118 RepID=A0A5S3PN96_9FLAO|nr:T9SS type A sorting domain-containing protein [Maribacter algarum]TMM55948.1 T9SS type A sorting domain-containing protein [Maribacter algarum]